MTHGLKFLILHDCLSVFILTKVITKANILAPIRIRIDRAYQRVMSRVGYVTVFSPSGCFLCVSCWVATFLHQPEWFLPTYSIAYLLDAFSNKK